MCLTHARFVSGGSQGESCPSARNSRPRAGRENSQEELVCVDLARSRPSTAQGKLVKACQVPDENPGADEGLNLLGVTLVLPAIQSIELPRDHNRAEQAIAKRWAASQASSGTLSLFFGPTP